MNRGWSSLYSRASSRRPLTPPPDYGGILFDNSAGQNAAQPTEMRDPSGQNSGAVNIQPDSGAGRQSRNAEADIPRNDTEKRENVTLPLPMPEIQGLGDCAPRFPLSRKQNRKYTVGGSCPLNRSDKPSGLNSLAGLLENTEFDDLLLAGLILMMLECGAERNIIFLLGILLIA